MIKNRGDLEEFKIIEKTKYGITANNGLIKCDNLLKAALNKYCADPELELIIKDCYQRPCTMYYCMKCHRNTSSTRCGNCMESRCRQCSCPCTDPLIAQCFQCNRVWNINKWALTHCFCQYCDNVICQNCYSRSNVICDSCSKIHCCKICSKMDCKKEMCFKCNKPICNEEHTSFEEKKCCINCMGNFFET